MRIHFLGAAGEVTGSCYVVETAAARVMVDFGLHQGEKIAEEHNRRLPPFDLAALDAVVLTHAHVDHIGRVPMLAAAGFHRAITATPATRDLCGVLLRDSVRLQAADAERAKRRGVPNGEPLYTEAHVEAVLPRIRTVEYGESREVTPGITIRMFDSGHMLGSASVVMSVREHARPVRTIVFSGDVGPRGVPLLNDPSPPAPENGHAVDLAILESTYGDRDHRSLAATVEELTTICQEAAWGKEKMFVPAFAVGRAQLVIYYLGQILATGRLPAFPVFLDSPMAITAMGLYHDYARQLDAAMRGADGHATSALEFPGLHLCDTIDESKRINGLSGPLAVIAGSGMCNGGRILHHLHQNLWRKDARVIITGYQGEGTLGRRLVTGAPTVRIFGEEMPVRARVHTLGGLSAHAGQTELVEWAAAVAAKGPAARWVLTHGEDKPRRALADKLRDRLGVTAQMPVYGDVIEL
jgi:metallo-beta-lactamase family protein